MRLSDFIVRNMETILVEWETFAADQLPAAAPMKSTVNRAVGDRRVVKHDKEGRTNVQSVDAGIARPW